MYGTSNGNSFERFAHAVGVESVGVDPSKAVVEPIAIIGIGCRFPGGAHTPAEFWNLLTAGRDAIIDVPEDRWDSRRFYSSDPNSPGKMYVRKAGFMRDPVDQFDPFFFGISPREAVFMDPQQRLVLEVTWEAL